MRKFLALFLLLFQATAYADITEPLNITEEDGSPSVWPY